MFSNELPRRPKRHSVPTEKSSIFHRFLRTPNKQQHHSLDQHNRAARPAPLDLLDSSRSSDADSLSPTRITSQSPLASDSVPSSPTSPSSIHSSSSLSPKYTTRSDPVSPALKSASSPSTPQSHSSLARIKRSITSRTKGRRVGADPDSRLVPHSAVHNKPAVADAEFIYQKDETLSQPVMSALLPTKDLDVKKQNKLKRWQNKGATKIKGWLNLHPPVHTSIDPNAVVPNIVAPIPDHLDGHNEHNAYCQITVAHTRPVNRDSLVIRGPCTPCQEDDKEERAPTELHSPFQYSSQYQSVHEYRKSHRRRLSDIFADKTKGPGRIPPRSSSLPRSFNPSSLALNTQRPSLKLPESWSNLHSEAGPSMENEQQDSLVILEDVAEYSFEDQFPLVSCIHVINAAELTESSQWMDDHVLAIDPKQGAEEPEQQAQLPIIPAPAPNQAARRDRDMAHQKRRKRHSHQPYSLATATRYRRRRRSSQSDMHDSACSLSQESSCDEADLRCLDSVEVHEGEAACCPLLSLGEMINITLTTPTWLLNTEKPTMEAKNEPIAIASEWADPLEPLVPQSSIIDTLHKMFPSSAARWGQPTQNPFLAINFWSFFTSACHEQGDPVEAYDLSGDDQ